MVISLRLSLEMGGGSKYGRLFLCALKVDSVDEYTI